MDNAARGKKGFSDAAAPDYLGHRDRLRERFRKVGTDGMEDYEVLELLLYPLLPRRDTKSIAKTLIKTFGSLGEVLGAPERLLSNVQGIGPKTALELKIIAAASSRSLRSGIREKQVLGSWSTVMDYLHSAMAFENIEQFRILFLDKKNALIADEKQQHGTVDHTPVYPREIVKRALELSASALILFHNHPSGDPTPSRADIDMTKTIIDVALPMGITVHDHIIIGKDGHSSMKGLQLI